jgi:protein-tyrosine phosphatase
MCPTLFTIRRDGPGHLSTMARPQGGDRLAGVMRDLAAAGVSILVSMLSDAEMAELDLADESGAAAAAGIAFYRLPTPDFDVPDRSAALELAANLLSRLCDGASVAVHCRGGIGRSSILAAAVLILEGARPADAMDLISAARGMRVPETASQRGFIASLSQAGPPRNRGWSA